jgi:NAD(P)-dependent dehydrogenase (short-subunit alcohol dehydrogenase family)
MRKVGLVTGGSSGIGLAIARMLLEEGFELTIASRREEKLRSVVTELGADVHAVAVNVANEADCERLVTAHRERFGRLDVLVNSAGIGIAGTTDRLPLKHWDLQFAVNVRAIFLISKLALPLLRESRGLVVNLASIAGTIPTPGMPGYGASKAAVISLTRSFNGEVEDDGVRAVALCPGYVDTPMAEWSGIPGQEMIRPEDCAEVVRMLLRLGPRARIPQIVVERLGEGSF